MCIVWHLCPVCSLPCLPPQWVILTHYLHFICSERFLPMTRGIWCQRSSQKCRRNECWRWSWSRAYHWTSVSVSLRRPGMMWADAHTVTHSNTMVCTCRCSTNTGRKRGKGTDLYPGSNSGSMTGYPVHKPLSHKSQSSMVQWYMMRWVIHHEFTPGHKSVPSHSPFG